MDLDYDGNQKYRRARRFLNPQGNPAKAITATLHKDERTIHHQVAGHQGESAEQLNVSLSAQQKPIC